MRKQSSGVSGNTKAVFALIGLVLAISLALALGAGRSPVLQDWYSASGVFVAAVGSVAVLSLMQSERQEAERNRRESALLTLEKCESLRPLVAGLEELHDSFSSGHAGKQIAPLFSNMNGAPLTRHTFNRLMAEEARRFVEANESTMPVDTGSPLIITTDVRPKTEEELQASALRQLESMRQDLSTDLTLHLNDVRSRLGAVDSVAAFLLEAECNLELAYKVLGPSYLAVFDSMKVVLAAADAEARVGGFPFAVGLYDEFAAFEAS